MNYRLMLFFHETTEQINTFLYRYLDTLSEKDRCCCCNVGERFGYELSESYLILDSSLWRVHVHYRKKE
jgi:hypothetical protein